MAEVGLKSEFEGTPPHVMEETLSFISSRYGCIQRYLNVCGFGVVWQKQLRSVLLTEISG